jgi:4-azaleucine resistance transporter AzlC
MDGYRKTHDGWLMDNKDAPIPTTYRSIVKGVTMALPIVFGYIPIGFAYGVLAQQAGLSTINTILMSILVYAGSSQLIAVSLFGAAVPGITIILTTFVVNLRHMLFSAALTPYLKTWKTHELAIFSFELTDESFAVHSTTFMERKPAKIELITVNVTAQISWVLGTILGVLAGSLIKDVRPFALDFTLPAMFVALLVMQIKSKHEILVAFIAGTISVGLIFLGLENWNVIIAAVIGASLGVGLESTLKLKTSEGY